MSAPRPTQGPHWLQLNGVWIHLDGVRPASTVTPTRQASDLNTVDGVRWVQQAPLAAREWAIAVQWAEPVILSALRVAAANAPGCDPWLVDEHLAQQNMLAPAACYGTNPAAQVVDCGGVPLRALDTTADYTVTVPVRAGVTYYPRVWGGLDGGRVLTVTYPGSPGPVTASETSSILWPSKYPAIWPGGSPGDRGAVAPFTPAVDGVATVTVPAGAVASGLMVSQDFTCGTFLPGQKTPCRVQVVDPATTLQFFSHTEQSTSDATITLREVG